MILAFLADGGDEFTSGVALSDKLGLSRTAVWKHVETLRRMGYGIEAVPSRGYRLVEVPDRLTALELSPLLATHDLGRVVHFEETMASTNAAAFQLATEGAFHGEAVVAEEQTQGRGRRGRGWVSPAGKNLYCSVILRPELSPARASELTLVAAVALAETVTEAGAQAKIKWPNDVQIDGRKVGGILTELSAEAEKVHFVVLGVGVNLNMKQGDFPAELSDTATSLLMARGQRVPRALFTAAFWTRLEQWLDVHEAQGFAPVREQWKKLSATLGQEVLVKTESAELRGTAVDIDDAGALLVKTPEGKIERVLSGDVEQVRPRR